MELRKEDEVTSFAGKQSAPDKTDALNTASDVAPNGQISAIFNEIGVLKPDYNQKIKELFM